MKELLAVQSADGMRLEEVNPNPPQWKFSLNYRKSFTYNDFKPASCLTDDPTVVAGEKYEADKYYKVWQVASVYGGWEDVLDDVEIECYQTDPLIPTRQILRRKAEGEKETEKMFTIQDMYKAAQRGQDYSAANADTIQYDTIQDLINSEFLTPLAQRGNPLK